MIELWDDRCVQIMPNNGIAVQDALVREVQSMKNDDVKRRARIAELEAERDRMREALQVIASGHFSGTVELVNTKEMKTVWKSDVGLPMTVKRIHALFSWIIARLLLLLATAGQLRLILT